MMDKFLYRVTTKKTTVWSSTTLRVFYVIAATKKEAIDAIPKFVTAELTADKVALLGAQCSGVLFSSARKKT